MAGIEKRWVIHDQIPIGIEQALIDYPPILRQLLYNRGYENPEAAFRFLQAEPPPNTHPLAMSGIPEAVDRLQYAIRMQEAIAIYGDYDVDGVTATALLVQFLENLGANVREYIPNRFEEGYGLNQEALASLKEAGVRLVVTVDCGIRSPEEASFAKQIGLDLIISDHHHPGPVMPQAFAVINPKQPLDPYPDKNLAGVGLAYKLASGLVAELEKQNDNLPDHCRAENFLDLVALGTVSDLAPLVGENRTLVCQGMKLLRNPIRQGIQSLIGVSRLSPHRITTSDIGYILGPRLNAAGRLDSAIKALKLLISQSVTEAGKLALELDDQNRERQKLTQEYQIKADEIVKDELDESFLLFAADHEFNPGLVGLVASRLTELYYRPAIVAHRGEEKTRASCRSIPEFHITEALDQCADLLEHHGGHAAAAGFTVRNENLPSLIENLKTITNQKLAHLDLKPSLFADMEIPLSELKPEILKYIEWLQPTGQGNRNAAFVSRALKVIRARAVGKDNAHLKLTVSDGTITFDAIAFRQGSWLENMPQIVDLLFTFEVNEFNGHESLQLNVRDIKPHQSQDA
jgi:single-stranded-DNA-specific exonuclease